MVTRTNRSPALPEVVLHDYFAHRDGGGKLAMTLARDLGWPVVAGSVSPQAGIDEDWPDIRIEALGTALARPLPRIPQQAWLWSRYARQHEKIVFSGYYTPLASRNFDGARCIYYCNTPPRFLYDQSRFWMDTLSPWTRATARGFLRWYRPRYEEAVARMDKLIVNSENVRRRVKTYLGRDGTVVHPPCDTASYYWRPSQGYYLSTARLDPIKRVDRIVDAFKAMPDKQLVVTSDGPMRESLRRRAGDAGNIAFTGPVDSGRLRDLLSRCIATVYVPVDEDFGLSPVESLASGKPVVGVEDGGVAETVEHERTGLLISGNATPGEIETAVRTLAVDLARSMREECLQSARSFDVSVFTARMRTIVDSC